MPATLPLALDALPTTGALVVAFSGGLDSTALLHALATHPVARDRGLRAVHVHHGLQAGADAWAAHCARQASAMDVALRIIEVQVSRRAGLGLEGAARQARYQALASALQPGEVLVTAHHQDDQAETFLLRALRASGPEGLGAMRPLRRFAPGWHWRPLLATPRPHLLDHARAHGLDWIEDPSNAIADAERNFLRLQVLPLLQQRWPHAAAALARSAQLSAQADALLQAEDTQLLRTHAGEGGHTLPVDLLLALPAERSARLLRRWVRSLGLPPLPARGVAQVTRSLLHARPDAEARFAWAGARVLRWRGLLHADLERTPLPADWSARWEGREMLALPGGGQLLLRDAAGRPSPAGFDAPVQVRARHGGERIHLAGRQHSHALKHLLQERGVPPWRRAQLPLLCAASGQVLAAGDVALASTFGHWLHAHGLSLCWHAPGDPR